MNMKSYMGQGLAFNGVDQTADIILGGIRSISFYTAKSTHDYFRPFGTDGVFEYHIGLGSFSTEFRCSGAIVNFNYRAVTNEYHTFAFIVEDDGVSLYIDGVFEEKTLVNMVGVYFIMKSIMHQSTTYHEGIINNIVCSGGSFTAQQVAYQYNNPEKFLYKDAGVLKSETLTQLEIDNVVGYFPLCETDGFVRNMVGYSEGSDIPFLTGVSDTANILVTNTGEPFTVNVNAGSVGWAKIKLGTGGLFVTGKTFKIKATLTATVGTPRVNYILYTNTGSLVNKTFTTGEVLDIELGMVTFVDYNGFPEVITMQIGADDVYGVSELVISNITFVETTDTYPITNYLSTMRTNAEKLNTGLQTAFWQRDSLGVPMGVNFNQLQGDKVGYVDTGLIWKGEDVEVIYSIIHDGTIQAVFGGDYGGVILVNHSVGSNIIYIGRQAFVFILDTTVFNHLYVKVVGTEASLYINGVYKQVVTGLIFDSNYTTYINASAPYDALQSYGSGTTRLFKVHSETQSPLGLYNNALAKGLLT